MCLCYKDMTDKNLIIIVAAIALVSMMFSHILVPAFPQQTSVSDSQRYTNGLNDGLRNSQQDSQGLKGHGCDPTVPTDVQHTAPYKKGYAVGYNEGPCGKGGAGESVSSSTIPGLTFRP
jgi:hypothetical protein